MHIRQVVRLQGWNLSTGSPRYTSLRYPSFRFYVITTHISLKRRVSWIFCIGSQTFLVCGQLKIFQCFTKHKKIDLNVDWRTISANLADHQWSAEQTLGITELVTGIDFFQIYFTFIWSTIYVILDTLTISAGNNRDGYRELPVFT